MENGTDTSENVEITAMQLDDRFRIIELIGEGASSKVYKAEHKVLNQIVAIKKFHSGLLSAPGSKEHLVSTERFKREAHLAIKLLHPNIVRITAYGISRDNEPFIVMEYCQGKSLDKYLEEKGRLSQAETRSLGLEITDALIHAHSVGIIHRDIKPGNIMISENKSSESNACFRLLDFGLAKDLSKDSSSSAGSGTLTAANLILGTPNYMSPEQCRAQKADERSDIYSLGAVLYECITGRKVFVAASDLALMEMHLHKNASFAPDDLISPEMKSIILKCLNKQADDRFKNTAELRDTLRRLPELQNPKKVITARIRITAIGIVFLLAFVSSIYFFQQESKSRKQQKINLESQIKKKDGNSSDYTVSDSHIAQKEFAAIIATAKQVCENKQYGRAIKYYNMAKSKAMAEGNFEGIAESLRGIAETSICRGKDQDGIKYYDEALQLLKVHEPDSSALAKTYYKLANAYYRAKDYDKAEPNYKEAMKEAEEIGLSRELLSAISELGLLYSDKKDYVNAKLYQQRAYKLFEKTGFRVEGWRVEGTYLSLAQIDLDMNDFKEANEIVDSLYKFDAKIRRSQFKPTRFLILSKLALSKKQYSAASKLAMSVIDFDNALRAERKEGFDAATLGKARLLLAAAEKKDFNFQFKCGQVLEE